MLVIEKQFQDETEKQAFVLECEAQLEQQLDAAIKQAVQTSCKIVTLSGPSCSGKTTTAHKLIKEFEEEGKTVGVVSFDDFFKPRALLARTGAADTPPDFDSFAALDADCLAAVIDGILRGGPVDMPRYDFVTGTRAASERFCSADYDIILFEGIQAVYPEVRAMFGDNPFYSLYISVAEDCMVNGVFFDRRTVRLCRRLVRDEKRRNSPPEFTWFLWESVAANEEKSIIPYEHLVDAHINSLFGYEMFMVRDKLCALLDRMPQDNPFYKEGQALKAKVAALPSISIDYLPEKSLYREFVGA